MRASEERVRERERARGSEEKNECMGREEIRRRMEK